MPSKQLKEKLKQKQYKIAVKTRQNAVKPNDKCEEKQTNGLVELKKGQPLAQRAIRIH